MYLEGLRLVAGVIFQMLFLLERFLFLLFLQHLLAVCSSLRFLLRAPRLTRAVPAVTSGVGVAARQPAWRTGSSLDGELGIEMLLAAHTLLSA